MRSWHQIPFAFCLLFSSGCGSYADFSLASPAGTRSAAFFRWAPQPAPVLERGAPGEWDAVDVLNPSVVEFQGTYYNFYSGFDGKTWHTGLATSADGVSWTKRGRVLSPDPKTWEGGYIAANGSALRAGAEFLYWYQAGNPPRIGLAQSPDGRKWTKLAAPVLRQGPRGSWDERGAADSCVIRAGNLFYMYYLGQDRARRQRLGVARSRDGIEWEKFRTNPILGFGPAGAFDENGLGEPAVWASHGSYWMLYTGRDRKEQRRIGVARSADGVHWERVAAAPVFQGSEAWDKEVVCDPSVVVEAPPRGIRVWFGGGDIARPDERLNGQIGVAVLEPAGGG